MRTLRTVLLLVFASHAALAYEPERAKDNLAHEAVECSAYFMLASAVPSLDAATVQGLRERYAVLLQLSVALTSEKLTKARFELAEKAMFRELDGKWSNLSILTNKYAFPCMDFVKDPEARARYWKEKKD